MLQTFIESMFCLVFKIKVKTVCLKNVFKTSKKINEFITEHF